MSFLQPLMLAALPLIALPIIIHLINQRRFQTIRWAAMMFLLAANRLSRGYARLRQWLIMLFRMLAVAGLLFAASRPLASGWIGLAGGGRADTTLVLLDRSPSLRQQGQGAGGSKLETGRHQLAQALGLLGSARWAFLDSATREPRELDSPEALLTHPAAEPASTSADLPTLLQTAYDYLQANHSGRAEIWICSDLREHDWQPSSGRWRTLRDVYRQFPAGVRFHLLAYPQPPTGNLAVRVTEVRRVTTSDAAELLLSLQVSRSLPSDGDAGPISVPIQFEIEGARSELTVDITGTEFELRDHRMPLEQKRQRGWGRVSLPGDTNPADNEFYFVFDEPAPRHTLLVADAPAAARALQLAAEISPDPSTPNVVEVVTPDQLAAAAWEQTALLLWHAPLPTGADAALVQALLDRGGQVIFFPPREFGSEEFAGVKWSAWHDATEPASIENWRGDQDLLTRTQSGAALPVGELEVRRWCTFDGEHTPLATLQGGAPLLARVTTNRGGAYFCTTTAADGDSSLASNGVVLYVLVQRALAQGAAALGNTRQLVAGDAGGIPVDGWQQLAGPPGTLSTEYVHHAGAYAAGDKLLAVNRSAGEDDPMTLSDVRLAELFEGLDFTRVDDRAGNFSALIQEIWRLFQLLMMAALLVEAVLCLPRIASAVAGGSSAVRPAVDSRRGA